MRYPISLTLATSIGLALAGSQAEQTTGSVIQRRLISALSGNDRGAQAVPFDRSSPAARRRAADLLFEEMSGLGLQPEWHRYQMPNINALVDLLLPPYRGTNVYAIVPATGNGHEYVVLGAHYDSDPGSPGAVDNASGVALVYAVAAEVAALPRRERNFIFVFFDQEEDDEVGSRAFARWLHARELDVHSVHTADLIGFDQDGDRAVELQSPPPAIRSLYEQAAAGLAIPLHITDGASSDNKSFLDAGFPTAAVSEEWFHDDSTPHLHRETDVVETVDFDYLASSTRLVATVMRRLAGQ